MGLNGRATSEGDVKMPLMFSLIRPARNVLCPNLLPALTTRTPVRKSKEGSVALPRSRSSQLRRVLRKVTLYTVPPASSVM
jgi:hypothetical protein